MRLAVASFAVLGGTLGLAAAFAVACIPCDAYVCVSRLIVTIAPDDEQPLRSGSYTIAVVIDGVRDEARCEVADNAASVSCTGLEHTLYTPRYGSPDAPHRVFQLDFEEDEPPRDLRITILHDGSRVLEEAFAPDYALAEPGCDDDCLIARNDFALPSG